jgi:hypothetical protein
LPFLILERRDVEKKVRTRKFTKLHDASEFCKELTYFRLPWQMTVQFDMPHIEDGERYLYDEFVVDWLPKGPEIGE